LQKAVEKKDSSYTFFMQIANLPDFDSMHEDSRFQAVLDHLGLAKYISHSTN
jgi:hypothetical protein